MRKGRALGGVIRRRRIVAAMTSDFTAADVLLLYRERIVAMLAAHGMSAPRVAGLVGSGRPVPQGGAIELYVTVAGAHDWWSADMKRLGDEIGEMIGHPVLVIHRPEGREDLWPGEVIRPL